MIDTHCHLNDEKLLPIADRIVGDFACDKIESAICVGYDMPSSRLAVELADMLIDELVAKMRLG